MTDSSDIAVFFENSDLNLEETQKIVKEGLKGSHFGELYQQTSKSESISKNKGKFTGISVGNSSSGFGFRFGQETRIGYSYSPKFNKASLNVAIKEARQVINPETKPVETKANFGKTPKAIYPDIDPTLEIPLEEKIEIINAIEAYARSQDDRIDNVSISYSSAVSDIHIINAEGKSLTDRRPMSKLVMNVTLKDKDGKIETGMGILGGRVSCKDIFNPEAYKKCIDKAIHIASELLIAEEAPAGEMDVILAKGWPSVIIHEAVGHGLEGDYIRKDRSVYSGKIGEQVAAPIVTIIDQGNMPNTRGSLNFDDEGTPTQKNILIENGILKKYMQDIQNAQLMGVASTGNGRRQSYKCLPMPRMTNTYIANGESDPEDIIKSVKDGLYVAEMDGGQVDITSGNFNMNATLCYKIRNGKLCEPIKGASIIGDGLQVINNISMVGNDLEINNAVGVCGKGGQSAVTGNGQPTILVKGLTVGGSR